jgi:hypothetical protein
MGEKGQSLPFAAFGAEQIELTGALRAEPGFGPNKASNIK